MEDISSWKEKFEICIYAKKLIDKLEYLNTKVKNPVDIEEVKKVSTTPVNITARKCVNRVILTTLTQLR
ncbi:putative (P)ppGpp 3-pyrophosphohydrolase-like protein [Rickettsia endosymbiont of Ixodes pacificus]|nr:putative (P)ppGpp 3-pyrophosphohydrolase-like protein [Rickettsia endosymbiont of Ixodes pacificus]